MTIYPPRVGNETYTPVQQSGRLVQGGIPVGHMRGSSGNVNYQVQTVDDHELPEGVDLVIVERGPGEQPLMLLSGRPAQAWAAMRAYEDTLEPCNVPSLLYAVS